MPPPESYWRSRANVVIGPILRSAIQERWPEARFRRELREAYPFGERAHWPYTVWLTRQRNAIALFRRATGDPDQTEQDLSDLPLFARPEIEDEV